MNMTPQQISAQKIAPNAGRPAHWDCDAVADGGDGVTRTLAVWEHYLRITVDDGDNGTLTYPSVEEAAGHTYMIHLLDDGTNKEIAHSFPGTPQFVHYGTPAVNVTPPGALTANADFLVLYSDGYSWHVMAELST